MTFAFWNAPIQIGNKTIQVEYCFSKSSLGNIRGLVPNVLDWDTLVTKFELQSSY